MGSTFDDRDAVPLFQRSFAERFKKQFVFRTKTFEITVNQQESCVSNPESVNQSAKESAKDDIEKVETDDDTQVDDPLGTFSTVWDGAQALAKLLANKNECPISLERKSVLELGSGTGLAGLSAAVCGARQVFLTDLHDALPLLKKNLMANSFVLWGCEVKVEPLPWGVDGDDCLDKLPVHNVDVVLCADLVYRKEHTALLLHTLSRIIRANPRVEILMAQEKHEPIAWSLLLKGLREECWCDVEKWSRGDGWGNLEIVVVRPELNE